MKTNHLNNNNKFQHGSDQKIPPKFQLSFILVILCPSCSDFVSINIDITLINISILFQLCTYFCGYCYLSSHCCVFTVVDTVQERGKKADYFFFFFLRPGKHLQRKGEEEVGGEWVITCHQVNEYSREEKVVKKDLSFFLVITSFWIIFLKYYFLKCS